MKNYERFRDNLICSNNDDIDNSAYGVICTVVAEADEAAQIEVTKTLLEALMPEGKEVPIMTDEENGMPMENTIDVKTLAARLWDVVTDMHISKDEDGEPEWDMEQINEVTEAVEKELDSKNIGVCHPFFVTDDDVDEDDPNFDEDNDGILCCLSSDKCPYCPYENKTE